MKKIVGLLLAISLFSLVSYAQETESYIKLPTLGVHFFLNDFQSADYIRSHSLSAAIKDKQFGKISKMNPGLAINYLQGLSNQLDFSATLGESFLDYPFRTQQTFGTDNFLLEGDASIVAKMFSDKYWVSPYLQAGIGASKYKGYFGAFIPAGVGIQLNFFDEAFVLINAQYRIPVTDVTNYHFYYSIGVAGNLVKKKEPKVIPLPPPPVAEAPKDRDGDGIVDSLDACPDVAGLAQFKGCPDTDGDGIPDKDDKCPNKPGVARYNGCPIPDTDGDGINDENDKCPAVAGLARYNGCPIPDSDGDGVNDEEDKCPNVPGVKENQGCPMVKEEIAKKVAMDAKNIFFAPGSSKLLAKSFKSLNEVAAVLKADDKLKLDVEGYTDNTGVAAKNQALSEKRAKSVMDYLVKKGADAARVSAAGYGSAVPVADNKTAKGRAQNRRVELKLKY